jgi:hypothetical protein
MFNPSQRSQRTKQIALLTIFTALYIVLRFIPFSMLIGPTGGFLSLSDFLAPIIGILLGPYFGGLTVLLGNFGAIGLGRPMTFFGFDFLPDFMATISTGFLYQNKRSKWAIVVAINAALLAIFLVNPLTSVFISWVPFTWLHIVAFGVLLSPLSLMAAKWLRTLNYRKVAVGFGLFAFIGAMIQHLTGNILFETVLGQLTNSIPANAYAGIWTGVFLLYPVERLILIIAATLVGTPLLFLLNRTPALNPRSIVSEAQKINLQNEPLFDK